MSSVVRSSEILPVFDDNKDVDSGQESVDFDFKLFFNSLSDFASFLNGSTLELVSLVMVLPPS